jgi:predicted nucleotidyltransferase
MNSFVNQLIHLKTKLDRMNIVWAIFAGAAARVYGSTREITDIDILVKKNDMNKIESTLGIEFHNNQASVGSVHLVSEVSCTKHGRTMRFFMDEEMEKRLAYKLLCGVEVSIIPLEDNIILKAVLSRGLDQGKYDLQDIADMRKNVIDHEYLKKRILFYNVGGIVQQTLADLNVLR